MLLLLCGLVLLLVVTVAFNPVEGRDDRPRCEAEGCNEPVTHRGSVEPSCLWVCPKHYREMHGWDT